MRFFKYYCIIFVISCLPLISFFSTHLLPHTHDGLVHLARIGAYFKALQDGQIPVRWAGDLNYGYGMPLFNFIYQLPYFLASLFLLLGFGLVNSFKIVLSLNLILSGVFMFAFAKSFFNDTKKAFLVTVFYQYAPFRLVELLVRGNFGIYTYTFLPLVLLGLTLLFKKSGYFSFLLTSLAVALLILSHNALSLVFFAICVGFAIFFARNKKNLLYSTAALFCGLMLASFYWIPAILEHKYTYGDLFMKDLFKTHFPPFQNFFIPNFINSERFQTGGISVQFGLFHSIAIFFSIALLFYKKIDKIIKKTILFCLLIIIGALFLAQPVSKIFWENISLLRQFQFPWRFLGVVVFASSVLSVSFFSIKVFKRKWIFLSILILVCVSTGYYWKPPLGFDKIDEGYYWNYPLNTTYFGETDVIWSGGAATSYPKQRVEVISGKASIKNFKKKSNIHTFLVDAQNRTQLVDHTQYFPGWNVYIDGKKINNVEFQDPNHRGEVEFWISKGKHFVKVAFGESPVRLFADTLSVASLLGLFTFSVFRSRQKS